MGIVRGSVAAGAVLVAAFILGFAAETTSLFDEFWAGAVLTVIVPLALLTAALAASFGEKEPFVGGVLFGVAGGFLTGIMLVLGFFSPFALELGERDLNDFGGPDLVWGDTLAFGLIIWGAGGAVVGAACGIAAWALRFALGRMRSDREQDTREAAGER